MIEGRTKWSQQQKRDFCIFLLLFMVMICMSFVSMLNLQANDGYWHMAMGRYMWTTGEIPKTAVGAWGGESLSWLPQEWLFEWLSYGLFRDNMIAMCVFARVCIAALIFLVGIFAKLYQHPLKKICAICVWFFFGYLLCASAVVPRPQTVSVLLTLLFIWQLRKMLFREAVKWYHYGVFVLIGILWANLHAGTAILGYLIPIGVVVCYMIVDKFAYLKGALYNYHKKNALNRISWIGCIMAVCCFLTPNGVDGFLYPMRSMSDSQMLDIISEWASPNFNDVAGLLIYYVPLAVFVLWLFFSKKRMHVFDFAVIGFMFFLGILHIRLVLYMLPVWMMLWLPYVAETNVLSNWCSKWIQKRAVKICSYIVCVVCIVISVLSCFGISLSEEGYDDVAFFELVKGQCGDRMYNYYDIGSICQYYDIPVFIDARYDPFSDNRISDLMTLEYKDSRSDEFYEVMEKYDFTSFLSMQDSSVLLWAADNGYEKVVELPLQTASNEDVMYEFWVKMD